MRRSALALFLPAFFWAASQRLMMIQLQRLLRASESALPHTCWQRFNIQGRFVARIRMEPEFTLAFRAAS
jgi:hypothetical protein